MGPYVCQFDWSVCLSLSKYQDGFGIYVPLLPLLSVATVMLPELPLYRLFLTSLNSCTALARTMYCPCTASPPPQVVYILDQVRALEQEMRRRLEEQGLPDIKPNIMVVTRLIPQVGRACVST